MRNIYDGDFVKDKAHGRGIFNCRNGDRYEGEFFKDAREGKGIWYYANGDRMMGNFHNNKPIGKHIILQNNGKVNQKIFEECGDFGTVYAKKVVTLQYEMDIE